MSFNFNARTVFLTYPKSSLSKERLLQALNEIASVETHTVSIETHKDGTPHLHAVIRFTAKVHTRNQKAFDVDGYHPNIQKLASSADFLRATKYIKKDGDFISNYVEKVGALQLLAQDILQRGLTAEVVRDNPTLIFKNLSQIRQWLGFVAPRRLFTQSPPKKRHIWLYGPSNTGKTHWLRAYRSLVTSYEIPENNDFSHVQKDVEALYVDEYRGFLTVQQLNRIADGDTILNTKGGSLSIGFLVVVVISNFSIRDVYKNVSDGILDTVFNRFFEYDSSISMPKFPSMSIKL